MFARFSLFSFFVFSALINSWAFAASSYHPVRNCGSARIVGGDTCSNVKAEFSFAGCALHSEPQLATKVICKGQQIKVRYQSGAYRYEAQFTKVDNGWGVNWVPNGAVQELAKNENKAEVDQPTRDIASVPRPHPLQVQPAPPAPEPAAAPASSEGFKFSGFFDFRYSNYTSNHSPTPETAAPYAESGFGVEDGALYGSFEKGNLSAFADIAFRRSHDQDYSVAGVTTAPRESSNNTLVFGLEKSQLYLRYKLTERLAVDAGQFDALYGVEVSDSKDRVFGKTGIVSDSMFPATHTGVMVEYSLAGFIA